MRLAHPARAESMKSHPVRSAFDWFGHERVGQDLASQAKRLQELQHDVDLCAPSRGLVVTSLDSEVLVLTSSMAGMSAKVRQFEPSLVAGLNRRGWRITKVRMRTRPREASTARPPEPKAPVSAAGLAELDRLLATSQDEALRGALQRLLRNQRRRRQ